MKELKIENNNIELNSQLKNLGCLINILIFWFGILPLLIGLFFLLAFIVSIVFGLKF